MTAIWILIIVYILILVISYIFIWKRLEFLNDKHVRHTSVDCLVNKHHTLLKIIGVIYVICGALGITVIVTFF